MIGLFSCKFRNAVVIIQERDKVPLNKSKHHRDLKTASNEHVMLQLYEKKNCQNTSIKGRSGNKRGIRETPTCLAKRKKNYKCDTLSPNQRYFKGSWKNKIKK